MPNLDTFFDDLEAVLKKHFKKDWEWQYNTHDGYQLVVFSETLAKLWEEMDEEYPDEIENFVDRRNKIDGVSDG